MRAVVLADTHIRRGSTRRLPDGALRELDGADVVLHAGDIVVDEVLDGLRAYAPVRAVLGNNDVELEGRLPEQLVVELAGVRVGMVHDSGPRKGREGRLHRRFEDCALVVFGHSHIPWDAAGIGGQHLLNPGSPTERRRQPHRTLATIDLDAGEIVRTRIVQLD